MKFNTFQSGQRCPYCKKTYKDFISIKKFNQIVFELVKKNLSGPFNVSLGKKIYIKQLIEWLNYYNLQHYFNKIN